MREDGYTLIERGRQSFSWNRRQEQRCDTKPTTSTRASSVANIQRRLRNADAALDGALKPYLYVSFSLTRLRTK